jgi:TRAP-type C4-dicarboxylate transport system permease small subunit
MRFAGRRSFRLSWPKMAKKKGKNKHAPSAEKTKASAPPDAASDATNDDRVDEPGEEAAPAEEPEPKPEPAPTSAGAKSAEKHGHIDEVEETEAAMHHAAEPSVTPKAWGNPIAKIDDAWTWFESRLLVVVLITLIVSLMFWVSLNGLKEPLESDSRAGFMFRAFVGMIGLGGITYFATGRLRWSEGRRSLATAAAVIAGAALAPLWRKTGVEYFGHVSNWLQEGSSLTMFGGLRGVSTRLTILLAMIGASLAAATGKHINIDVVIRFMKPKWRVPFFASSSLATMAVCLAAAWGFFDYISVQGYGAAHEASRSEKIAHIREHVSRDLFVWRKQMGLDMSALGHVLRGGKWDDESRMNGHQWNAFIEESGYREHFKKEEVDAILAPPDQLNESRIPLVVVPGSSPRGLLIDFMNLTFPFGLILLSIRFLLKMLRVLSGHSTVDAEGEPDPADAQPPKKAEEA